MRFQVSGCVIVNTSTEMRSDDAAKAGAKFRQSLEEHARHLALRFPGGEAEAKVFSVVQVPDEVAHDA